jgi:hypothetical protein
MTNPPYIGIENGLFKADISGKRSGIKFFDPGEKECQGEKK